MIEFLVVAAILVAASLVFVLLPLWRAGAPTPDKRREANVTIYHQRYAEIEREVAAGRLDRHQAEMEKDELGARLLADIDGMPSLAGDARVARHKPWLITLIAALLFTAGAGGSYAWLGDWRAMRARETPALATMIAKLEARAAAQPDDLQARAMLARAQFESGEYAAAASTYGAIRERLPEPEAALVAAQAQATLMATDDLQGRAGGLYRQLLELDPDSAEALWYLGLAAAERGDNAQAINHWDRLLEQDLPGELRDTVRNRRNELSGDKPMLDAN